MNRISEKVIISGLVVLTCFGLVTCNKEVKSGNGLEKDAQNQPQVLIENEFKDQQDKFKQSSISNTIQTEKDDNCERITFPLFLEQGKEVDIQGFYDDTLVFNDNLYLSNTSDNSVIAYKANINNQNQDSLNYCIVNQLISEQLPFWLDPESAYVQSFTQDFNNNAYLLVNWLKKEGQNEVDKQSIIAVDLEKSEILREFHINEASVLKKIRYLGVSNHFPTLLVEIDSMTSTLFKLVLNDTRNLEQYMSFEQNILTWDHNLESTIVMLSDKSIQVFCVDNPKDVHSSEELIKTSFPYTLEKPHIVYNQARKSFVVWEAKTDGNSWIMSSLMPIPSWINLDTCTYAIVLPFMPGFMEREYKEEVNFKLGNRLLTGPKAWLNGFADFTAIAKPNWGEYPTWGELGMQTTSKDMYQEWFDYYSTKPMQDGRYVGEEESERE